MKVLHTQEVMSTSPALLGRKGVSTGVALRQRVQQCLRLLQVSGVKALGEPSRRSVPTTVGLGALALPQPETGQAHGGAQFQGFGLLVAGDVEGLVESRFGLWTVESV